MKISKAHGSLAELLQYYYEISKQDVLDHPENFLGPNWEAVINFWLYLYTLSKDQLSVLYGKSLLLSNEEWCIAYNKSGKAAEATTKYANYAGSAAYGAFRGFYSSSFASSAAVYATEELIGLQKLLEQGHQPVFFPMFLNP